MQLYTRIQSIFSILQWLKNLVRSEKTFTNQKKIITIQPIKNQFNDIYFDAIDTADYQLMGI
jgi:predicted RNA methylase